MYKVILAGTAWSLVASASLAVAEDTELFNKRNLDGWTYHVRDDERVKDVNEAWVVQEGMLVSTGMSNGYLKHAGQFENYVLTLEWRSMRLNDNGIAISGLGSLYVHASDEEGTFHCPKSVEVSLDDIGGVYFRDVDVRTDSKEWAFRAPDFADDVEKDLGEWNQLRLICAGNRMTVIVNGTPVNQVEGLNRTKGAIAIKSSRGSFPAPMFYRNLRVQPVSREAERDESIATKRFAKLKALDAAKDAAAEAKRREEERREKMRAEAFEREWEPINVAKDLDFTADVRRLPFPADAREFEFDATFGDIELTSAMPMAALSKFYRTEMARRGWTEVEKQRDEDSIEVTFKHGDATVELSLDQKSDGVAISLDCEGLSFAGTNKPAELAALGIPQPRAYVFLQKEFKLPDDVQDLEYDSGNRCMFKSSLGLQAAFDQLCGQLRAKGYRETRRPIVSSDRRYTEFAKGRVEVSINIFSHEVGSRCILTYEEN